jgi:uncharacterized protein (DUF2267 family)
MPLRKEATMSATGLRSFDHSLMETREWIKDIKDELKYDNDEDAYESTRAILHVVRDRLTIEEAANFASQLPMLLKGVYYESYRPEKTPLKIKDPQAFFDRVSEELPQDKKNESSRITKAFMKVVRKHVTEGLLEKMENQFPENLKEIFE